MSQLGLHAHLISFACINSGMFSSIKINDEALKWWGRKLGIPKPNFPLRQYDFLFLSFGETRKLSQRHILSQNSAGDMSSTHPRWLTKYLGSSLILLFVKLPQVQRKKICLFNGQPLECLLIIYISELSGPFGRRYILTYLTNSTIREYHQGLN